MGCPKGLTIPGAFGDHLYDPAGAADPVSLDPLRPLFRPQGPGDVTAMAKLVIDCHEGHHAFSQELATDPAPQGLPLGFNRQEEL